MDELKRLHGDSQRWDTERAVQRLSPEIRAAAAQIRKRRQDRLQLLGFLAAALALMGAMAFVLLDYNMNGQLTHSSRTILIALGAVAALATAFAPVLAYFAEEEQDYEFEGA